MSVIHTTNAPLVTVAKYHEDFFGIAATGEKAEATMHAKGKALIVSKYADRFPSYNEWENDLAALKAIAERKGLTPHYVFKVYRRCMESVFGALPVSLDSDAKRVRESRAEPAQIIAADKARAEALTEGKCAAHAEALAVQASKKAKTQKKQATAGAPAGESKPQAASVNQAMEQYIAQFGAQGIFIALDAVTRILAAEKTTEAKAKSLTALRNQLAREMKPAEVASA